MNKLIFFAIIISLVASCKEDPIIGPSGTVNLNVNAKYAGQPLVLGQTYSYGSSTINLSQFNLFISNVTLLEAETEDETDLMEVALADFNASDQTTFTFKTVPAVKYRGMKINFGVPSGSNKASANSFGAGHPLKKAFETHFWADGNSFFFMKLAGVFGSAPDDKSFELFPAKNGNQHTMTLLKSFSLTDGESVDLNLDVDVLKLLQAAGSQPIDFTDPANLSTYDPENDILSSLLMGNFENAAELE